ncbi:hypothetical protein [Pyrococcus yayanosii]|uniref:Uncharacterized protein n=1 Tax=Pyrococcus yayanosii (strain CH1 / JCM 16557) TaxID=529709 RepID=F8AG47_PYRYC|nr:hypothetical protein [Pyrococcus yayanosii]AEH25104.1 hypothetical protein PYCH_14340 [Pyrococcus yayanosii CH1]
MPRRRPRPGDITTIKDLFKYKSTWVVSVALRDGRVKRFTRSGFREGKYSEEDLNRKVRVDEVWIYYKINWHYFCEEVRA